MKQIVQNYNSGQLRLEEVPVPICKSGTVLVQTIYSLVSVGTERMKVSQARMSLVQKAKARPDKVKQVVESVRQVGLIDTYQKVRERLDALTPLGYSLAGRVVEVGSGIDEFEVGDVAVCAGEGIACHAEFVCVPRNLCVRAPAGIDLKDAAFTTVGAIAMNGVRQAGVALGESVLVIGLGLVGLIGVQLLKAAGCRVIGVDMDAAKLDLARICGAELALARGNEGLEAAVGEATGGVGVDVVYIAASTKSADPMQLAGRVTRDRGRVVVVGMVPVEADWQTYYQKELSVLMSRSYGPGRYDRNYEQKGLEYPIGYVRWTERRNMEEFLRLIANGSVRPSLLDPKVYPFDQAPAAYQALQESGQHQAAGVLFKYDASESLSRRVSVTEKPQTNGLVRPGQVVSVSMIGAGNFATATLIPALKKCPQVRLKGICSSGGLKAKSAALRHGFEYCASDYQEVLQDEETDAVIIATHHDTHARFAAEALRSGKQVFVEKPLALNAVQLNEVIAAQQESGGLVMPGFNRRFSPLSVAVRDFFATRAGPIEIVCRVNAGVIGSDSWYQDPEEGGWRIVSEGCHFVDLIQFICGSRPESVSAECVGGSLPGGQNDNCVATMKMADGSLGTLIYVANGAPSFEKERIEVFGQGRSAVIENWQVARLVQGAKIRKIKPAGSGKGHGLEMAAFIRAVAESSPSPLPLNEAVCTTLTTFAIVSAMASGRRQRVSDEFESGSRESQR